MPDTVFDAATMSRTILVTLWRDGLLAAAAQVGHPLKDPKAVDRAAAGTAACPFVVTAFPDRNAFYPIVVIGKAGNDLDRIDARGDLQSGSFDVEIVVHAETTTHLGAIGDAIKKWAIVNRAALQVAGFVEAKLISDTPASWDESSKVLMHRLVYRGLVHAT